MQPPYYGQYGMQPQQPPLYPLPLNPMMQQPPPLMYPPGPPLYTVEEWKAIASQMPVPPMGQGRGGAPAERGFRPFRPISQPVPSPLMPEFEPLPPLSPSEVPFEAKAGRESPLERKRQAKGRKRRRPAEESEEEAEESEEAESEEEESEEAESEEEEEQKHPQRRSKKQQKQKRRKSEGRKKGKERTRKGILAECAHKLLVPTLAITELPRAGVVHKRGKPSKQEMADRKVQWPIIIFLLEESKKGKTYYAAALPEVLVEATEGPEGEEEEKEIAPDLQLRSKLQVLRQDILDLPHWDEIGEDEPRPEPKVPQDRPPGRWTYIWKPCILENVPDDSELPELPDSSSYWEELPEDANDATELYTEIVHRRAEGKNPTDARPWDIESFLRFVIGNTLANICRIDPNVTGAQIRQVYGDAFDLLLHYEQVRGLDNAPHVEDLIDGDAFQNHMSKQCENLKEESEEEVQEMFEPPAEEPAAESVYYF